MNKNYGIRINGDIFSNKNENINHDEFLDKFIEFIEKEGYIFGGMTFKIDEEGNKIDE